MKKTWPSITSVTNHGKEMWRVDSRFTTPSGERKGERKFFDSKGEAQGYADWARGIRKKEGLGAFHSEELEAFGWTVQDAIRLAVEHLRKRNSSVPVEEAIKKLIETKEQARRNKRYTSGLGNTLKNVAAVFSGKTVGEITTAELNDFLGNLRLESGEMASAGTWNTYRRDLSTLWSFAEKHGWAQATVARNTERAKGNGAAPVILLPEEAAALLAESEGELLAFHAIGVFAGLRPSEIRKLQWGKHVNFIKGFIELDASITKTGQRRLVPILPSLRAWLEPISKPFGTMVITGNLDASSQAARKRAGIKWSENIMRHSFVSYRLADRQNAAEVAEEAGHSVTILRKHYRELVTPEDAKRYFQIVPLEIVSFSMAG
jgi:integrase